MLTDSPSIPSPEFVNDEEPLQVSHLWTSMSKGDKQDMALGLVSCKELEKIAWYTSHWQGESSTTQPRYV
jgi:hypothetical protein